MQVPFFSFKPHNPGLQPVPQCIQALDMPKVDVYRCHFTSTTHFESYLPVLIAVPLTLKHNTGRK